MPGINDYMFDDMLDYNHDLLEKWSYGLDRIYPKYCPHFDKNKVSDLINKHLDHLIH